jgi:aldehyde dehydrogenase (NAD+)
MLSPRFADRYESYLDWIGTGHRVFGSSGTRRITADNPARASSGDPDGGLYYHPVIVDGVGPDDQLFLEETFGPIVGVSRTSAGRGDRAGQPARVRAVLVDLHHDPTEAFRFRAGIGAGMVSVNNSTRAPRRTCRSAATGAPATVRASRAAGCWTSSPGGRR